MHQCDYYLAGAAQVFVRRAQAPLFFDSFSAVMSAAKPLLLEPDARAASACLCHSGDDRMRDGPARSARARRASAQRTVLVTARLARRD